LLNEDVIFGSNMHNIYFEINSEKFFFNGDTGYLEYQITKGRQNQLKTSIESGIVEDIFQAKYLQSIETEKAFPQPQIFTIFIAATCNMACSYCLNSGGTLGLKNEIMTSETAKNITTFLQDYVQKTDYDLITINLYGGEPFTNPQAVKEILKGLEQIAGMGYKAKVKVLIMTNGTIHDKELINFVKKLKLEVYFAISLDGGPERHNAHRRLTTGKGTWQEAFTFTQLLRKEGIHFSVTAVVPYPYEYTETAEELIKHGFKTFEIKDVIPYSYGGDPSAEIYRVDFSLWRKKYLQYTDFCLCILQQDRGLYLIDHLNLIDNHLRCYRFPSPFGCGLFRYKIGIDVNGTMYPCESFVHSEFRLGNVRDGWKDENVTSFAKLLREEGYLKRDHLDCKVCFAKYVCGGGCYAVNWDKSGKFNEIMTERCLFIKEKLKIDLYFISKLAGIRPDLTKRDQVSTQCS